HEQSIGNFGDEIRVIIVQQIEFRCCAATASPALGWLPGIRHFRSGDDGWRSPLKTLARQFYGYTLEFYDHRARAIIGGAYDVADLAGFDAFQPLLIGRVFATQPHVLAHRN